MTNWHARLYTRLNQVLLDICFFSASMALACMIHVGAWLAFRDLKYLLFWLPLVATLRVAVNHLTGVYRLVWRFISISDAIKITRAIAIASLVLLTVAMGYPLHAPYANFLR